MNFRAQTKLFTHLLVGQEVIEECLRSAWRTGWDVMQPATSRAHERFKCACVAYRGDNAYCQWHGLSAAKAIGDYGFN